MKNSATRRKFLIGAGASVGVGLTHKLILPTVAKTTEPTLNIYVIIWRSVGGKIPWNSSSPQEVAEKGAYVIWAYIQQEIYRRGGLLLLSFLSPTALIQLLVNIYNKGSIIGHAALYAKYQHINGSSEQIVFSNTGSNVGMYIRWYDHLSKTFDLSTVNPKFPKSEPYQRGFPRILACCYLLETLAGHLSDGTFETIEEFKGRVKKHSPPRVSKQTLKGTEAEKTFSLLKEIKHQTSNINTSGAPKDYGLNTTEVRKIGDLLNPKPVANLGQPQPMKSYLIGGEEHQIYGGCANAVASVLKAAKLQNMIEDRAKFRIELSFDNFKDAVIPILVGANAFNRNTGKANDADLIRELQRLPQTWGSGNTVEFFDPNYWYDQLPANRNSFENLLQDIQ
ncbi:hypothetical protein [Crocosphaera chwakensis]|uniref:Uncharacterized protein n=1 Tax=Crocosphaera chwakensis CCY0110 TaxID=391612 RepID=A3IVZ6_9CHRO|nr:hypothetical protein [Crocosphaera chwakensis]EAZ89382.1 hypothetical protein CY0110_30915 [Crocosphaera chwakensis CCY0110]